MILCPNCGSDKLFLLSENIYRCMECGYEGNPSGQKVVKRS